MKTEGILNVLEAPCARSTGSAVMRAQEALLRVRCSRLRTKVEG